MKDYMIKFTSLEIKQLNKIGFVLRPSTEVYYKRYQDCGDTAWQLHKDSSGLSCTTWYDKNDWVTVTTDYKFKNVKHFISAFNNVNILNASRQPEEWDYKRGKYG